MKGKMASLIISAVIASSILSGCGSSSQSSTSGKLTDGVYKVEYDNFDSHEYKGQLELTVSGGKITEVKYDEIKKDGTFKSKDEQYKKQMEEGSKTYPEKAYTTLKQELIEKQTSNVDSVSGATASSENFKKLAKYAIDEMAKKGVTTPAKIPASK